MTGVDADQRAAQTALPREHMIEGEGSPGLKNPDALRYDPRGARNAMTTNWAALKAGLRLSREMATGPAFAK